MKKASALFVMMLLLVSVAVTAQTSSKDYFVGKWDLMIEGLPDGDLQMRLDLSQKDGKLAGTLARQDGNKPFPLPTVTESEKSISFSFEAQGYDINIDLEQKENDTVSGMMMGMFSVTGKRTK